MVDHFKRVGCAIESGFHSDAVRAEALNSLGEIQRALRQLTAAFLDECAEKEGGMSVMLSTLPALNNALTLLGLPKFGEAHKV